MNSKFIITNDIGQNYLNVFRKIYDRLYNSHINWVVTGSFAFAIQGIPFEVHDIDIQADEEGAYQIEQIFSEFVTKNVTFSSGKRICSHFGALEIDGIKVEIMGDIQKRLNDGTWENPVDLNHHKQFVDLNGMQVPVLSLDYEYEAYLRLGRIEKADIIKEYLVGRLG